MTDTKDIPRPRTMTLSDLWAVVEIHKKCFPASLSIFTALGDDTLHLFYRQAVEEDYSVATVLEEPNSGQVIAFAIGTMRPGFRLRLVRHHLIWFCICVARGLFTSSDVRKRMWNYVGFLKRPLRRKSRPPSTDPGRAPRLEGNYMTAAVHPQWRRRGNATRILDYFVNRMFDAGSYRVRARVRTDNLPSLAMHKRLGWHIEKLSEEYVTVWKDRPGSYS